MRAEGTTESGLATAPTGAEVSEQVRAARRQMRQVKAKNRNPDLIAERRRAISDAAIEEFDQRGFQLTSVESIARAIGIDKRTIYDYIEKKEDILYLILSAFLMEQVESLEEIRGSAGTALERLRRMLEWHLDYTRSNSKMIVFTYREMRSLPHEDISSSLGLVNLLIAEYESVLRDAAEEEAIRVDDVHLSAHALTTIVDMLSLREWTLSGTSNDEVIGLAWAMLGVYPGAGALPEPTPLRG